jgi:hypothetical protein
MVFRRNWILGSAGCAVFLLASCGGTPVAGVTVERHSLTLNLLVDGSVEVRETLVARFGGEPVSSFERHVARERADAFFDAHAAVDGRPVDGSGDPVKAVVDGGDALSVRWEFPPLSDGTREFTLEYRASNAVSVHGANGVLHWPLVPLEPGYAVESSEVNLTVPSGTVFMEPPGIQTTAEWTGTPGPQGLVASRTGPGGDVPAMLVVRLAADTLSLAEPLWQYEAARNEQLMPAWSSGGLFMVVIGLGAIWMLRVQFPNHRPSARAAQPAPDEVLPVPAIAQALRRRRRGRAGAEIPAAIRGLLDRGLVAVERPARAGADLADADPLVLSEVPEGLLEHERALVDELWLRKGQGTSIRDLRGSRQVRRTFASALTRDLAAAGYATPDRVTAADGLWIGGITIMMLGLGCAAAVPVVLDGYGTWPYAVPAGIFVMGLMLLPFGAMFSILTEAGERASLALGRRP